MSNPKTKRRKLFRPKVTVSWTIIEKEAVDEIIFRTANVRNRLILELMARGGMRIGEADRLREYARQKCKNPNDRIFPISYEAARIMVLKAGNMAGVYLRPHDLRRHAATYASRSGVPIEIISKIILRQANLSTTQLYLGKINDTGAIRWIENVYA